MTIFRRIGRGVPSALGAAALFGASTPVAKALLGAVSPWLLAGLLYLGSGVGLAIVLGVRRWRGAAGGAKLQPADWPWLLVTIVAGGIAGPVLLMLGLAATEASTAALLLNLESVFALAIAWRVFHEYVDRRIGLGAAAVVAGGAVLSWGGPVGFDWANLWIVGACFAWAIDDNLTRKISGADPLRITAIKGLVAGGVNVGLALALGGGWPPPGAAAIAGIVGFLGYGVSLSLFVVALRELGAARTMAYFSTAPFVGAALAIVGFGEPVTPAFLAAAVLMAAGVALHLTERHQHEHVHEPMEHEHWHWHDEHHQHAHAPGDPPGEPHSHRHVHARLVHSHPHYPDIHHRHSHG
ncbi:MAG: DMT family transporter [Alphaproteobacteria bacterium]|nr:DMT family transporter [Alphaproteobacteria bacterium]